MKVVLNKTAISNQRCVMDEHTNICTVCVRNCHQYNNDQLHVGINNNHY